MLTSKTDIIQEAYKLTGIGNLTTDMTTPFFDRYDILLRNQIESRNWAFSFDIKDLTDNDVISTTPRLGFKYAYELPDTIVAILSATQGQSLPFIPTGFRDGIISLYPERTQVGGKEYVFLGRVLYTNNELGCILVKRIPDPQEMTSTFQDYLIHLMADYLYLATEKTSVLRYSVKDKLQDVFIKAIQYNKQQIESPDSPYARILEWYKRTTQYSSGLG